VSRNKRDLDADEQDLWTRVAATVRAKRKTNGPGEGAPSSPAVTLTPPAPAPRTTKQQSSVSPADRGRERRVRRGKLEIEATLDLHGHSRQSARSSLKRFLTAEQARGRRVVVVVTGAGRGGEGVLRRCLPEWLGESDLRALTSGYAQAHRSHGGAGAFYVFLKRSQMRS
jgi:DNA-nicking Smr family endonuclease